LRGTGFLRRGWGGDRRIITGEDLVACLLPGIVKP